MYVVQIDERKTLVNGFMPINDMILYINQRMKLLKQYQKMQKLNIKLLKLKPTVFFMKETTTTLLNKLLNLLKQ